MCGEQAAFDKCHFREHHSEGVCTFPSKSTWATRCSLRIHSEPHRHQVEPSASCWGQPGATPRRGRFDSRLHRPTMSSATEATRGYTLGASNPRLTLDLHTLMSIASSIAMRAASSTLLTVVCVCSLGAQGAFNRCHFRVRHFGVVFISPYKCTCA